MGVNIDTDSNNSGYIDGSDDPASDPSFEEHDPGNILRYNDDDDNGNDQPDRDDPTPFKLPNGSVAFDNDLEPAIVSYMQNPGDNRNGYIVEIDDASVSPNVKLWQSQDKQPLKKTYVIGTDTLPATIYAEGYQAGVADLKVVLKTPGGQAIRHDKVRFTVLRIDLDAATIDHNASSGLLDDDEEEREGAYLPVNNDDDDYDAGNLADSTQTGAIVGESDLLPITLHSTSTAFPNGKYTLGIPAVCPTSGKTPIARET